MHGVILLSRDRDPCNTALGRSVEFASPPRLPVASGHVDIERLLADAEFDYFGPR